MNTRIINNPLVAIISLLVVLAVGFLQVYFMGPAILPVDAGLVIAWIVWISSGFNTIRASNKMIALYCAGIFVQLAHFGEEYFTGFQREFPMLMSGYMWDDRRFLIFNFSWIGAFILSVFGIQRGFSPAYLIAWFFVLVGEIANGILHPLLCLYTNGYFPGLFTSVSHLVIGFLLLKEFRKNLFTSAVRY
ncbi:MAG TPA: hypothetical protein PKC72_16970 [Chitinophagaceae bacterium]|nr:hypothetical protein [Chitinophagaceae bacterium]